MLFRSVYHKDIDEETFRHKHFGNPSALPTPYIIASQDGAPVAMRWLMRLDFTCGGERLSGVQSSDDAVSENARGLLFLKMRKKTTDILGANGADFEYGCFSQGEAMEIAEKFGEKNVVDLQLARLFLNERTHRWKRFDIPHPAPVRFLLANVRERHLRSLARPDLIVRVDVRCPFSDGDYQRMNADPSLHIERNSAYYEWKTSHTRGIVFVAARDESGLRGYLVLKRTGDIATVADWDIFAPDKTAVLAAMILPICKTIQYLDIPSLNCERGEMKLFTDVGAKDMSKLWAPICICVKPLTERARQVVEVSHNWKHRLIDADFFLNGDM